MAIFKKKVGGSEDEPFVPEPDKARPWFDHARNSAGKLNWDYALYCYARGISFDPTDMDIHQAMYDVAVKHHEAGGGAPKKDHLKQVGEAGHDAAKFAAAELAWMHDLRNYKVAMKCLEAAVKAGAIDFGSWLAPRIFNLLNQQKKVSKGQLVTLVDLFSEVGAWEHAMALGERAKALDPSDGELDQRLKDLAAQRAMDQGGYTEAAGREGGFRSMIKDASKQQELIEEETLAGGASAEERNLARAKQAYEEQPNSPDTVNRYAQLLRKQGTPDSVRQAFELYKTAHEATGEYRFRMAADDLVIANLERKAEQAQEKSAAAPDDAAATAALEDARRKLWEAQSKAYAERVAKYPTDRVRKFDLGRVQYAWASTRTRCPVPGRQGRAQAAGGVRADARPLLPRRGLVRRGRGRVRGGHPRPRRHAARARARHQVRPHALAHRPGPRRARSRAGPQGQGHLLGDRPPGHHLPRHPRPAQGGRRGDQGDRGLLTVDPAPGHDCLVVIPARLGSSRFPGKLLASETGRPLVQHVWERATRVACAGRVVVAGDDDRIRDAVEGFGGEYVPTRADHPNGTSRIAEVVERLGADCPAIVVNVQGDEPDLEPSLVDRAVAALLDRPDCVVGTVGSPFAADESPADPNIVKVVCDLAGRALLFTRAAAPFDRDGRGAEAPARPLKHVGLYVYRRDFLAEYVRLPESPLEVTERLEQLRVLEHGHRIAVAVAEAHHHGIDTPEQYAAFVARLRAAGGA